MATYRVAAIDILTEPGALLRTPSHRSGSGVYYPLFLERHEESSTILLARGFNAIGVNDYWSERNRRTYAAYGVGGRGFYAGYYAIRDAAPSYYPGH